MRREEARRADALRHVLGDGPRQAEAVVGRRAAAQLVDDDERAPVGALEDRGRLEHLAHEGRDASEGVVRRPDASVDGVRDGHLGLTARHEATDLRSAAS